RDRPWHLLAHPAWRRRGAGAVDVRCAWQRHGAGRQLADRRLGRYGCAEAGAGPHAGAGATGRAEEIRRTGPRQAESGSAAGGATAGAAPAACATRPTKLGPTLGMNQIQHQRRPAEIDSTLPRGCVWVEELTHATRSDHLHGTFGKLSRHIAVAV